MPATWATGSTSTVCGVQSNSIGFLDRLSYIPTSIGGTITAELTIGDAIGSGPLQTFPRQTVAAGQSLSGTVAIGNIITANRGDGVSITDSASSNVLVGNTIGAITTSSAGTAISIQGNTGNGISITNAAFSNTIGDDSLASAASIMPLDGGANVVSGNGGDGILVNTGTLAGSVPNVVGGNLVSSNAQNGIHFVGNLSAGTSQVQIVNNLVGTTFSGSSTVDVNGIPQGNGLDGIRLEQSSQSVSGSVPSAVVAYNVSSNNGLSGINVQTSGGTSYVVVSIIGNHLGTDISGNLVSAISSGVAVPFGNALDGILLNEVLGVTVGAPDQGNIASGNLGRGIEVRGDKINLTSYIGTSVSNIIQDNLIGLGGQGTTVDDANGTDLGNLSDGIFLLDPGRQLTVGGQSLATSVAIRDNTVSNNQGAGIHAVYTTGLAIAPDGLIDREQPDRDRPDRHRGRGPSLLELLLTREPGQRIRRRVPRQRPDDRRHHRAGHDRGQLDFRQPLQRHQSAHVASGADRGQPDRDRHQRLQRRRQPDRGLRQRGQWRVHQSIRSDHDRRHDPGRPQHHLGES